MEILKDSKVIEKSRPRTEEECGLRRSGDDGQRGLCCKRDSSTKWETYYSGIE